MRNAYKILVGKFERKIPLKKFKSNLEKLDVAGSFKHNNK